MATTVRQADFSFSCLCAGKYFEAPKYFESANIVLPTILRKPLSSRSFHHPLEQPIKE